MKSKKLLLTSFLFMGAFFTLTLFNSNSSGITGVSSTGCGGTGCHGNVSTTAGGVLTGIPLTGYVPGTTYTLTLTVGTLDTSLKKAGFDLAVNGGTISNAPAGTTITGGNEIGHQGGGKSLTFGTTNWAFSWTAPNTDSVRFNYSTNLVNNNNAASGDQWRNGTQKAIKAASAVSDIEVSLVNVYPNPSINSLTIETKNSSTIQLVEAISVLGGKSILLPSTKRAPYTVSTEVLSTGNYLLRVHTSNGVIHGKFCKQ
jgi:Secretion system C-terminal sorting domain